MSNFDAAYKLVDDLRQFEVYELQAAKMLDGKLAPTGTAFYDVYKCEGFPGLTFQVKFSNVGVRNRKHARPMGIWSWHEPTSDPEGQNPSYYLLVGIDEDGGDHWFLLSRKVFIEHSAATAKGRFLQGSPRRAVWRGGHKRGYWHEPWIWRYHVKNPDADLAETVRRREENKQLELI